MTARSVATLALLLLAATWTAPRLDAWAAETASTTHRDMLCRTFKQPLDDDIRLDTSDGTSEIGRWVGERRVDGWSVHTVDLEVAPSQTGFPKGWVQVCLAR